MPAAAAISFDHIHLRSPDPEETARWFEEMLGAEVVRSEQDGQPPRIDLKLGGADIFIAPVPPGDSTVGAPPRPPHQGRAWTTSASPCRTWTRQRRR